MFPVTVEAGYGRRTIDMMESSKDAIATRQRLHAALNQVRLADKHVPCEIRPSLWTSNDPAEREAATHQCSSCPVRRECWEVSDFERLGVWGTRIRGAGMPQW